MIIVASHSWSKKKSTVEEASKVFSWLELQGVFMSCQPDGHPLKLLFITKTFKRFLLLSFSFTKLNQYCCQLWTSMSRVPSIFCPKLHLQNHQDLLNSLIIVALWYTVSYVCLGMLCTFCQSKRKLNVSPKTC